MQVNVGHRNLERVVRSLSKTALVQIVIVVALVAVSTAQGFHSDAGAQNMGMPSNQMAPQLQGVGIDQKLNSQVPLDLTFHDETGKTVQLGQYFTGRPVVLSLIYFNCPMLCPEVVEGMTKSLNLVKLDPGKDYDILTVSFDPRDTPEMAAEKKAVWLSRFNRPDAQQAWHFLTGDQDSITKLAQAVGFRYKWDPTSQQFSHATAIMVLTPGGKVSKYFYGTDYSPTDLRFGLIQASNGKIGSAVDEVLLFCCKYDVTTGKYDLIVSRLLAILGGATILILGSFLFIMFRLGPKHKKSAESPTEQKASA
jgi:protein SCO1/2